MMSRTPSRNLEKLSIHSQILYGSGQKAIKKLKFCLYHVRSFCEFKDPKQEERLVYCKWFRSFVDNNGVGEIDGVFFSDGT